MSDCTELCNRHLVIILGNHLAYEFELYGGIARNHLLCPPVLILVSYHLGLSMAGIALDRLYISPG
jgi:hypothetical protein